MKVWICDDNPGFLKQYQAMISALLAEMGVPSEISAFTDGKKLVCCAKKGKAADVVFLDIIMDNLNGIETAAALRNLGMDCVIVFITSSSDYAIDGYKVKAFRYILKPVQMETMRGLLNEICAEEQENAIVVPDGKANVTVNRDEIVYLERINRKTLIHLVGGAVETTQRLDDLEKQLDSSFIRCHKSFIVNFAFCIKLKAAEMILQDGTAVSISRANAQKTKAAFFEYHKKVPL